MVTGLVLLAAYVGLIMHDEELYSQWPSNVYVFVLGNVMDTLSPEAQVSVAPYLERLVSILGDPMGADAFAIVVFETTLGLPLFVLSMIGGWIWKMVGPKPETDSNP
jgi:hypothetical protein